tara:strand:+ start:12536 stop:12985 length:450 start_codon:yes stop_codon:yes gene_type:complete
MKRTRVKAKDVNKLLGAYGVALSKKDAVEILEGHYKVIVVNGEPSFFYFEDKLIPTLKYLQQHDILPKIIVDMGAVKFVVNGADIMRPGITEIDTSVRKDEFIVVVDENNKKALCVGIALLSYEEMNNSSTGKSVKNIHYVGDELWNDY